ncbi:methyltransferase family protein [Actinoalloteichus hymeniacidonis]|uniref:Methyltransferase family protein n=1 Tax=Actinoalloteichus hymeniacidonis TaxID=340345 RepID=A0AAC9HPK3_9PSEU|nr:methyltransferase family protein [Actinoalloteichus hymeniacidonis]
MIPDDGPIPLPDRRTELPSEAADEFFGAAAATWRGEGPVLDVGTGPGSVAAELAARGVGLMATDVTDRRGPQCPDVPFVLAAADELPFRSGALAGVHISRALHRARDWRAAVAEATRVLRPAGALCLDVGGGRAPNLIDDLLAELRRRAEQRGVPPAEAGNGLETNPDQVDQVACRGLVRAGDIVVDYAVEHTPRAAMAAAAQDPDGWAGGSDLGPLAQLVEDVMADAGVDPDLPLRQARTARYRVYRRPGVA